MLQGYLLIEQVPFWMKGKHFKQTARREINRYRRGSSRLWQDWLTEKSNVAWTAIFRTGSYCLNKTLWNFTRWSVASLTLIFLGTLPSSRLWSEKLQQGEGKQCCCLILQTVSILQFTSYPNMCSTQYSKYTKVCWEWLIYTHGIYLLLSFPVRYFIHRSCKKKNGL